VVYVRACVRRVYVSAFAATQAGRQPANARRSKGARVAIMRAMRHAPGKQRATTETLHVFFVVQVGGITVNGTSKLVTGDLLL